MAQTASSPSLTKLRYGNSGRVNLLEPGGQPIHVYRLPNPTEIQATLARPEVLQQGEGNLLPRPDGSLKLQFHRVPGGRLWWIAS